MNGNTHLRPARLEGKTVREYVNEKLQDLPERLREANAKRAAKHARERRKAAAPQTAGAAR